VRNAAFGADVVAYEREVEFGHGANEIVRLADVGGGLT
jgi:hypothetical protein